MSQIATAETQEISTLSYYVNQNERSVFEELTHWTCMPHLSLCVTSGFVCLVLCFFVLSLGGDQRTYG